MRNTYRPYIPVYYDVRVKQPLTTPLQEKWLPGRDAGEHS